MRGKILLLLLLFPLVMMAKKAPKWKPKTFVEGRHEIRFAWKKAGSGDSIRLWDYVNFRICFYNTQTKKFDPSLCPSGSQQLKPNENSLLYLTGELQDNDLVAALLQMKVGSKAFCIIPNNSPAFMNMGDSSLCYIEVISAQKGVVIDQPPHDSVDFVMPDPLQGNYGDTLFTSAKLLKTPNIVGCGHFDVTQVFEFELSWFDNGVQHKNILVYIQCPDFYGANYFVEGKSYIITAIPLTDRKKQELNVVDQFPNENLERYFLLRMK